MISNALYKRELNYTITCIVELALNNREEEDIFYTKEQRNKSAIAKFMVAEAKLLEATSLV